MSDPSGGSFQTDLFSFPGEEASGLPASQPSPHTVLKPPSPPVVYDRWPHPKPAGSTVPARSAEAHVTASVLAAADHLGLTLEELRTFGGQLVKAYGRLEEQYQEVDGRSERALELLAAIERRVGPLETLRDLSNAIDDRMATLERLDADVVRRTHLVSEHDAIVARLEHRASAATADLAGRLAACEARATQLTAPDHALASTESRLDRIELRVTQLDAQAYGVSDALDAQQRRLADVRANTTALESAVDEVLARATALSEGQASCAAAEATVRRLEQLAAQATVELERVSRAKASLDRALVEAHGSVATVTRTARRRTLEVGFEKGRRQLGHAGARLGRRVRGFAGTVNWAGVRSADLSVRLAGVVSAIALVVLFGVWSLRESAPPRTAASAGRAVSVMSSLDSAVSDRAPRTADIVLPSGRSRAVVARAGGRPTRNAAARR